MSPMTDSNRLSAAADTLLGRYFAVGRGAEVLITADDATDARVSSALVDAANRLGAHVALLSIPRLPYQGALADPYLPRSVAAAGRAASVWIDLTFPYIAGAKALDAALESTDLRYLLLGDAAAGSFARLYAGADLERYFDAQEEFDALIKASAGESCRIICPRGTDVSFRIGRSTLNKPRNGTGKGMYLVPGTLSLPPDIETVRGTIVVSAVFHEFYEALAEPIRVEVDSKIRAIHGGGASGRVFERALKRAAGAGMGSIIHFSHGLHPAARFTGTSFIEDIRVVGHNAVGFGVPWWEPGGGENHPDGVTTEHTVAIAGRTIVERGTLVWPERLRVLATELLSRPL